MSDANKPPVVPPEATGKSARSEAGEIEAFVRKARALSAARQQGGGRLILALDATMSRQHTWDMACRLQAEMFDAASGSGKLQVQLAYFRGLGECRASKFVHDTSTLKDLMVRISCRGGHTQIDKIFKHALSENARERVNAVVFIGDAMEEPIDDLAAKAGELGLRGVPLFLFQEGNDGATERAFKEFARLSKGAWFRFDRNAASALARLLSAVAVFASGGLAALEARGTPEDRLMLAHLRNGKSG